MQQFIAAFAISSLVATVLATVLASRIGRLGFPLPPETRRIGCIDGLRGYLALAVLIHHAYIWIQSSWLDGGWHNPAVNVIAQLGSGSVALFFMTTGFVFYPRLLAGLRGTSWLTLYVTRFFRIIPLTAVSVVLVTALIACRTHVIPDLRYVGAAVRWVSCWGEVPLLGYNDSGRINAYVLWSLWYEWLFYLLMLPVTAGAADLVRRIRLPTWLIPASLLCIGSIGCLLFELPEIFGRKLMYLSEFAIGMLAFELQSRSAIRRMVANIWIVSLACVALLLAMVLNNTPNIYSALLYGIFFACVACGYSVGGLLTRRSALVLGECSFGIYLIHGIVLDVLFVDTGALDTLPRVWLSLLVPVAAVVVVLATPLTYLLVERPAIRYGKVLARRIAERRVAFSQRAMSA